MYRIFLILNTSPDEMVVVWRLQTLAAASGLHLDVPNYAQRENQLLMSQLIDGADAVMVLLTHSSLDSPWVVSELNYSITRSKTVIPIFVKGVVSEPIRSLMRQYDSPVFILDPAKPGEMESHLSKYLLKKVVDKNTRNALLALAGTFAGLFLLSQLSEN